MDFGELHLPTVPGEIPPLSWTDISVNRILIVVLLAVAILQLRDYLQLYPLLSGCMVRSRGNLEIEHSVSQARNRNRCTWTGLAILCVLADRYGLYQPGFLSGIPPQWSVASLFGIALGYLIFRSIFTAVFRRSRLDSESRAAGGKALFNYFLAILPLMLLSVALLWVFGAQDGAVRVVLYAELIAVLMFTLVREGQIIKSKYSSLQTFLYLCALELIPLAALIVPAAVL